LNNLASIWMGLDLRRRIAVVAATVGVFVAVLLLARGASEPDMALLYAGLDASAAGDVVASLEQQGVTYEVRGAAIYVPSVQRDMLRMTLASEGLPQNGGQGYEILDSLSGFGTTAQMFDAAYLRAKEGELARTILASPGIRTARVHISVPVARPFARDATTAAAVTVTTAAPLAPPQVEALRFLVASSVSGLLPENVAVIDSERGLIPQDGALMPDGSDRADMLQARAERLLAARVGPGNAVVEVTVDTVTESESILERRIDPEGRVAISTDVEESTARSTDPAQGDVTVASNLPDGDAAQQGGGTSSSEEATNRALTNYEVSETSREIIRAPGDIRRLTVAVLVNDLTVTDAEGATQVQPRTTEELDALRELVASAVGFDEERGDVITIRSMSFEPLPEAGTEATVAGLPLDMMSLIRLAVLAVVALILGLFVVRPILAQGRLPAPPPAPPALAPPSEMGAAGGAGAGAGAGGLVPGGGVEVIDPVTRIRKLIDERKDESARLLQSWIETPPPRERN
jgi:flagellar M-ring protein FliF